MIFEPRFIARFWLPFIALGISFAAASFGITWIWIPGWILLAGVLGYSFLSSRIKLGESAVQLLKCLGLAVLGIAGIVLVSILVEAGGSYRILGWALGGTALAFIGVYLVRFWSLMIGASIRTLYHQLTGKGPLHKATFLSYRGEFAAALERIDEYQRARPEDPAGYAWRAGTHLWMGRTTEAAEDVARALAAPGRDHRDGLAVRGQLLLRVGALEQAVVDLEESLRLAPRVHGFRTWKALALVRLGSPDEAISELARDDRGLLKSIHTPLVRGEAFMLKGDAQKALKAYKEAVKRGKCELRARLWQSEAYLAMAAARCGELDQAETAAQSALERGLEPGVAHYALALVATNRGDALNVEESIRQMIEIRPHLGVIALAEPQIQSVLGESLTRDLDELARREAQTEKMRVLDILRI